MGRSRAKKAEERKEITDRLAALGETAKKFKAWKPAGEALVRVRAHPTIFPLVDEAIGVGGWPIQRVGVVHGPSNHGKSAFVHGLGLSFLNAANFYAYVDAEYTTPVDWLQKLMGHQVNHPGFVSMLPKSYNEAVAGVREFAETVANDREKGVIPADTTGLIVIDSVRKLVPDELLKKMLSGKHGFDGARGRAAMIKAALNTQWLDELVPTMYHANLGIVFISREYEANDPDQQRRPGEVGIGQDHKVGGGRALIFDSSIVARITRSWVKEGSDDNAKVVGERHRVSVTKTKVGGKDDRTINGFFHTSNGKISPIGFDRARDVFELAVNNGVITAAGSWYSWGKVGKKWQGANNAIRELSSDLAMLDTLEGESRTEVVL